MSLKEDQVPVSKLNDCRTCQDERTWASHRSDYFSLASSQTRRGSNPKL